MNFARRFLCASAPGTLDRILLGWGFLIFAAAQGLAAQSDDWHKDLGIRWSASSVVPPLTISGIVINVVTGEPVARAQVYLEDLRVGAVTDAEGRFDFQAPGPGEFVLSAMGLAYDLVSDTIRLGERSGLLIQIGLVWVQPRVPTEPWGRRGPVSRPRFGIHRWCYERPFPVPGHSRCIARRPPARTVGRDVGIPDRTVWRDVRGRAVSLADTPNSAG